MCQCQKNHCACSNGGCGSQSSCSCGCSSSCPCSQKGSSCGCKGSGESWSSKFLELADQAWMEVLKEKMKEHIKTNSKNIDELAKMIAQANEERWQKKIDSKHCCDNFDEKLKGFFGHTCCAKK